MISLILISTTFAQFCLVSVSKTQNFLVSLSLSLDNKDFSGLDNFQFESQYQIKGLIDKNLGIGLEGVILVSLISGLTMMSLTFLIYFCSAWGIGETI